MDYLKPAVGITAHRTILHNKVTGVTFVATRVTEENQCEGENRNHIIPIGDLSIAAPDSAALMRELYEEVKHGDEEHRQWLKTAFENFIIRKCL